MKEIVISREGNRGERGHTLGEEEARFVKSPLVFPPQFWIVQNQGVMSQCLQPSAHSSGGTL